MANPNLNTVSTATRPVTLIPKQLPKIAPDIRTTTEHKSKREKPIREEIHYPESDGMPMAENTVQYKHLTNVAGNLEILYKNDPNVFIAGDLFWYPVEGNPNIKYAPDVMVAFGRPKGDRGSYKQWEEDNIPFQVVFEIWSPGNDQKIKDKKFAFYNRYGVEEYYTYDPDKEKIEGWIRKHGRLRPISDMLGWRSPLLGIQFTLKDTKEHRQMQLYYPDGRPFLSRVEESDARESAEKQSEVDRSARVEAEAQAQREAMARAEAEAQTQREASARAEAETQVQREASARAEAEAQAQREADERQREASARAEAEAQAQREADERQREASARIEAEAQAQREAAARAEAEAQAQREAMARSEAEDEATRAKALLRAAMEQLQKAGLPLPDIDAEKL